MRNLRLILAYDGTDFHGWQIQPRAVTVQGLLTQTLESLLSETVQVFGSGRTDAGVHAEGQVANFKTASTLLLPNLMQVLNDRLPPSVRVRKITEAPLDFHARYQARSKTYRYRIWTGKTCPPFLWRYVHHHRTPLDVAAMERAAEWFEGEADFASFAVSNGRRDKGKEGREPGNRSTVRRIFRSQVGKRAGKPLLVYEVQGSGFLHHMVRNMVGTLLEVGRGKLRPEDIPRILLARRRPLAGPTVPAKGLTLVQVEY